MSLSGRVGIFSLLLMCGMGAAWDRAAALEPSGTTLAVNPSAAASGSTGRRVLEVMGPVFMGDRVQTGPAGEAQIKFRDETRLVVGPNSLLTIDAFVFNENNSVRQVSMHAAKGAFRFITGAGRKQAYSISTPAATIGIRGTRFDFAVRPNGETVFALFEGQARLCDRRGRCMDVRGACSVVVAPSRGGIEGVSAGPERAALLASLFPYVVSQARLRPDFRVNTSACRIRQANLGPDVEPPVVRRAAPNAVPVPSPSPVPEPAPAAGGANPGNGKAVGNAGDRDADGVRGNSGAGTGTSGNGSAGAGNAGAGSGPGNGNTGNGNAGAGNGNGGNNGNKGGGNGSG